MMKKNTLLLSSSAFLLLLATTASFQVAVVAQIVWGEGIPTLGSGSSWTDDTGDVHYVTYAEERAPVEPIIWEIYNRVGGSKLQTNDVFDGVYVFPPAAPEPNVRYKDSISYTHSETYSETPTPIIPVELPPTPTESHVRYSYLNWWATDLPRGATAVEGTKEVESNENYQFVLSDVVFPLTGVYNLHYNVTMYYGAHFLWNRTVTVNKQPQALVLLTTPLGYNGTAMSPSPEVEFRDFFEVIILTNTPVVTLTVLSKPEGATFTGSLTLTATEGTATFDGVVPSLPGTYLFRLDATLSDDSVLSTSSFQVVIEKALPVEVIIIQDPVALARYTFVQHPLYQVLDAVGLVQDDRTVLTLSLYLNQPSLGYEGQNTLATLSGTTSALPINYYYTYEDLSLDLPGSYEIEATLFLDGEIFLNSIVGFTVTSPPTWTTPEGLTVNTQGIVTMYGVRPISALIKLRMAREIECTTDASNIVEWLPEASTFVIERNITFTPFTNGDVYLCMQVPESQEAYVPLLQHYVPSFSELYPLLYTFTITDVAFCLQLDAELSLRYRIAGWNGTDEAKEGRRYGCRLSPPVSGTVPPCDCPTYLSCEEFSHSSFTPPGLDIGRCVCCKDWVMAIAGTATSLLLVGIIFVIYMWA